MPSKSGSGELSSGLLQNSVYAILGGLTSSFIFPPYATIGYATAWCGVVGVAYYLSTWSKFDRLFKNLGLCRNNNYPICTKKQKTENGKMYKFTLPAGLTVKDFDNYKLAIEQYIGREVEIKYTYKEICIEVFDGTKKQFYPFERVKTKGVMEFPAGFTRAGKPVFCDLADNEPHMIVCGETGSGKSVFLRGLITYLILEKNIDIYLIDYKQGAEFKVFEKSTRIKGFSRNTTDARRILKEISLEVDRRYSIFSDADCVDIKEYNKKHTATPLRYQALIIDEFAEMEHEKDGMESIQMLTAKARSAGIHVVLSTQRPSSDVINGRIKANCATVLGLKCMNGTNSRIIIDHEGLERLRGNGHAILKNGGKEQEIQCMFLTTEQARELIRHTYKTETAVKTFSVDGEVKDFSMFGVGS